MSETEDRSPALNKPRFICPKCEAFAAQKWYELTYHERLTGVHTQLFLNDELRQLSTNVAENSSRWNLCWCTSCDRGSMWRGNEMIYPQPTLAPVPDEEMPESVRHLYIEAGAVAAVSRRAGAALARATLELLLKELLPEESSNKRLDDYIALMHDKVSEPTWKLMTVLRHTGNQSLHIQNLPEDSTVFLLGDEDESLLEVMFQTINNVVEELITKPKRANDLYSKVPEKVRTAAESKATKSGS